MFYLRKVILQWLVGKERGDEIADQLLVKIQWRIFDSLNKWQLEWGVGEGKLREEIFTS